LRESIGSIDEDEQAALDAIEKATTHTQHTHTHTNTNTNTHMRALPFDPESNAKTAFARRIELHTPLLSFSISVLSLPLPHPLFLVVSSPIEIMTPWPLTFQNFFFFAKGDSINVRCLVGWSGEKAILTEP